MTAETVRFPDTCTLEQKRNFPEFRQWEAFCSELEEIDSHILDHRLYDAADSVTLRQLLINVPQVGYEAETALIRKIADLDRSRSFLGGQPWTSIDYPWPKRRDGKPAAPLAQLRLDSIQHLTPVELEPAIVQIWWSDGAEARAIPLDHVEGTQPTEELYVPSPDLPCFCGGADSVFAVELMSWTKPMIVLPSGFADGPSLKNRLPGPAVARVREIFQSLGETPDFLGYRLQLFGLSEARQYSPEAHYAEGSALILNLGDRDDSDEPGLDLFSPIEEVSLFAASGDGSASYFATINGQ